MKKRVIIKSIVAERFERVMKQGRVLFFSAPCGFGKTCLAEKLTEGLSSLYVSADQPGFSVPDRSGAWQVLVLDDLQTLQEDDWSALCALIRDCPERRFLLLSRGVPPGCLMAFQYAGLMEVLNAEDLLFDRKDIRRLFHNAGVTVSDSEVSGILKESIGYPLGVEVTAQNMAGGKPFGPEVVTLSFRQVFLYFESAIYLRFDLPVRRFLLELASFETFDLEMARMVSGNPHAGEMLDWLQRNTTMLRYDGIQQFRFWPQFRRFLLWEMEREYSEEKRRAMFNRGGMYYELKEDYPRALACYTKGGDRTKVSELLIRNAELHPGMGHYQEMEKYYRALSEEEILAHPSLMQGMSMLCALSMDYEGSERWYDELRKYAERCGRQDAAGKRARSRLVWLDISLPQRNVEGLPETLSSAFRLMCSREISLPPFSVTSTMPSVMNGGKDFSPWSKQDDLLCKTIGVPLETVMGRDGVGLTDCALAESKFEKGEDISARMLALLPRMSEIRCSGTPDIEFAVNGLLTRSQVASGQVGDARRTLETLRDRFVEQGQMRFLPNLDAMLCRIDLQVGDLDAADAWYREKAPRDPVHLDVMKRYQYLTQAMVELADGRPDAALMTLAPLKAYADICARYIGGINLNTACAIALYRKRDENWRQWMAEALTTAEEYRFTRTISVYGGAVLPLLEEVHWTGDEKWYKRLLAAVRMQAAYYPGFLQPRLTLGENLTATELQILRLICADKSNAEIGQTMDIKLTTVKTHVSHVLEKLGVKRRNEAKTAAKKLWLVPEEL